MPVISVAKTWLDAQGDVVGHVIVRSGAAGMKRNSRQMQRNLVRRPFRSLFLPIPPVH